ncbi:MAG: hypothetical protein LBG52_03205 [Candidatus Peribacteria bacterium]|jgi:hypothetical protein|nr:hypothetical protein [Candidatus Peribacteria bacterium]
MEHIRGIIGSVEKHLTMLETLCKDHEQILDYFFVQTFNLPLAYQNYDRSYKRLHAHYGKVLPFSYYHSLLQRLESISPEGAEEVKKLLGGIKDVFITQKEQHQSFLQQKAKHL